MICPEYPCHRPCSCHTAVGPGRCGLCRSDQHLAALNEVPAWILPFSTLDSETLPVPQPHWLASLWVAEPSWNNIAPSLPQALDYLQLTRAFTPMSSLEPPCEPWEPSRTHQISVSSTGKLRLDLSQELPEAQPLNSSIFPTPLNWNGGVWGWSQVGVGFALLS